ncbi:hypothetical protein B0T26DRAFT_714885 [Lasiosphaeria miniovina]|uniref:Uncharacterized protein n=1 Tax=Lasiosphaeria miniovina TaxID=1954250 RepID=A0AA40DRB1_9PEZI|nr:uncharacterized protein B0T26DRAFT_714885 [Lasiosphaeria miniovina]KAK0712655.1 hypothetical protein B0T26DRAFT_714885 [Lasiosphaeria miniovina]
MAQVLLIVSTKEVMGIPLSGEGLIYESLYANAKNCLAVGVDALRHTGERMRKVHRWANEMGRPRGTVDQMTKYLDPNQSAARDRHFKRYFDCGQAMASDSVQEICNIRIEFGKWRELTACLLRALEEAATQNLQQEQRTKSELEKKEMEKLQSEKLLEQERRLLAELTSRFEGALGAYEAAVNNIPPTLAGAGAIVGGLAAVGVSVPAALAGLLALGVQYSVIDSRRQEKTERINRLERETASLKGTLAELAAHAQSLSHLTDIVRRSINYLSDLQDKIDMFMEYLINIQNLLDIGTEAGKFVFDPTIGLEERQDKDIKKSIFEKSFQLKASFLFAAKAAKLYNDVSSQYIIPGINWFSGLRLLEGPAAGGLEATLDDITRRREKICSGAEELAEKMNADLDNCMETLIRETAKSFKEADPELWSDAESSRAIVGTS